MKYERLLLDIETQRDFFARGGHCFNEKSAAAAGNIYDLFDWARISRIPVISTVLRLRRPPMVSPDAPACCIEGTAGERKLARTILYNRIAFGTRATTDLPPDVLDTYSQVIFEKRHTDIFAHSRAERLISELSPTTIIICGAGIARGIIEAVLGLRKREFSVIVAADAVLGISGDRNSMACTKIKAKGAILLPTRKIIARSVTLRPRRRHESVKSAL